MAPVRLCNIFTIIFITIHRYYGSSENITLYDFHSVKELDKLYDEIEELMSIAHKTGYKGDLWLGETSSSYGGGRALYSESFISGFMLALQINHISLGILLGGLTS